MSAGLQLCTRELSSQELLVPAAKVRRIGVFRALQLGDLLCAVPTLRRLRHAYPGALITLIGLGWARAFQRRFRHLLDDFIEFPGYPGLPEVEPDLREFPKFIRHLQRIELDLMLQLHGSGSYVNSLSVLSGAKVVAGYYLPGEYCPEPRTFMLYPEGQHEIHRLTALASHLRLPSGSDALEFPLTAAEERQAGQIARSFAPSEKYICIHPGSRSASRRWPIENFVEIAGGLMQLGYTVCVTGSSEERRLARPLLCSGHGRMVDLLGRTTLPLLAGVLRRASLLICNDTGVSHIAAALKVPSVVIFTGSDPQRWAPLDLDLHRAVDGNHRNSREVVRQIAESILEPRNG